MTVGRGTYVIGRVQQMVARRDILLTPPLSVEAYQFVFTSHNPPKFLVLARSLNPKGSVLKMERANGATAATGGCCCCAGVEAAKLSCCCYHLLLLLLCKLFFCWIWRPSTNSRLSTPGGVIVIWYSVKRRLSLTSSGNSIIEDGTIVL